MNYQIRTSAALLLAYIVVLTNGAPPEKIIGGTNAKLGDYPYQVSIRRDGQHFCGGAIISDLHILTAAHCMESITSSFALSHITVVSGIVSLYLGGQTHKVRQFVLHDDFDSSALFSIPNDVAVLTLAAPIKFNQYQNKIELASRDFADNSRAVVAGWGYVSNAYQQVSSVLKKENLNVVHYDVCQQYVRRRLNPGQICGIHPDGQDTCQGDSGGPLALNNEVIGIVSWGSQICASGTPDVYTNVFHFRDFIQKEITMET